MTSGKNLFLILIFALILKGCTVTDNAEETENIQEIIPPPVEYTRFSYMSIDLFDTLINILGYAETQEDFAYFVQHMYADLYRLHKLFDKFHEHPGINNIKTINNNAGIQPVRVHPDIIELLTIGIEMYHTTKGTVNIAIGPVTNIWREYIFDGNATLPCMDRLTAAGELIYINDIIIDAANNTVFLRREGMMLDVGSIGKGFAMEKAAQKAIDIGFESFALTVGGDARLASGPRGIGDRESWGVGILNPNNPEEIIHAILAANTAVATSGDYQRFFMVDGIRYHHIIDPRTLMPAITVRSTTVIYPNSIIAENLSLAAFIMDINEAKEILAAFGAEAMWVLADGSITATDGF